MKAGFLLTVFAVTLPLSTGVPAAIAETTAGDTNANTRTPVLGTDAPLCTFTKRILAERPSEFAKFKGTPLSNGKGMSFVGKATPDNGTKCSLHVRRKISGKDLSPTYGCTKFDLGVEEAKALYAKYRTELSACFHDLKVSETTPNPDNPVAMWRWTALSAEYSIELEATDGDYVLTSMFTGKPLTEKKMSVSVEIYDLTTAPPGATMPEQP